jgi:glutathione-regulated potassium-efflux system ancillary protein KefC
MTSVWALFTLWAGLALIASLLAVWLRVSTALTEIIVGTAAQLIIGTAFGATALGSDEPWIKFLAGIGAIMLTFLDRKGTKGTTAIESRPGHGRQGHRFA